MARARNWREIRADALESGHITEEGVARAHEEQRERVRAHRLAEVRRAHGSNQSAVAERMHVDQSRVSRIERGEIEHTEIRTLRAYVEALGGHLRVEAEIDDEVVKLV